MTSTTARDGRFLLFLDESGEPPCDPPDDCEVCVLFTRPEDGEARADWVARIIGVAPKAAPLEVSHRGS